MRVSLEALQARIEVVRRALDRLGALGVFTGGQRTILARLDEAKDKGNRSRLLETW